MGRGGSGQRQRDVVRGHLAVEGQALPPRAAGARSIRRTARSSSRGGQGLARCSTCSSLRMRGGAGALVHQRDERAARDQLAAASAPAPRCPCSSAMRTWKSPSSSVRPAASSPVDARPSPARRAPCSALMRAGVTLAHERARHLGLRACGAPRTPGALRRPVGAATKAPRAGSSRDQPVLRQLEQRLPHQRARDAEMVGQLLLGQLAAGLQPVLDDGARQRIDDGAGGGGFHAAHDSRQRAESVYTSVDRTDRGAAMGLSTHVLDTMHGSPAAGMAVALYTTQGDEADAGQALRAERRRPQPDGPLYDNAEPEARHLPAGVRRGGVFQGARRRRCPSPTSWTG